MSAAVAPAQQASSSPTVILTKTEEVSSSEKKPPSTTKTFNNVSSSIETKESSAMNNKTTAAPSENEALPADLKQILTQVACTGKCPWLSWNGKDAPEAPMPLDLQVTTTASSTSAKRLFKQRSSSAFSSISASRPTRKKIRNGVHSRRRHGENGSSSIAATPSGGCGNANAATGRKRPFYLTRTPSTASYSVSSIGSGRTSGSEVEDSTQYECDSEGTSATTNSEVSVEKRAARNRNNVIVQTSPGLTPLVVPSTEATCRFKTLRGALRVALGLVLDNSYRNRGGYKLSPAELRIHAATAAAQSAASHAVSSGGSEKENSPELEVEPPSPEKTFQQRKRRLLALLGEDDVSSSEQPPSAPQSPLHHQATAPVPSYLGDDTEFASGPPFTIQRIAEVLLDPERYYKQTHKLCNCLEKLLLVTSSASSFGERTGADMSQSKVGGDNVSVASEKKGGRQDWEFRTKRLKRRMSSSSDDDGGSLKSDNKLPDRAAASKSPESDGVKGGNSGPLKQDQDVQAKQATGKELSSKEILEAAARAQLRSKFDHVGIDPHCSSAVDRSVPGIPNRGMTSSPPPPGLASAAALSPHGAVSGFARHVGEHQTGDSSSDSTPHPWTVQQNPTPFFSAANDTATPIPAVRANQGIQMLQTHSHSSTVNNPPPLELVVGADAGGASSGAAAAASSSALSSANVANLDFEPGRSSGTNSDVDSDDFSLDDSASDRSDGSDSGVHCEPFTAARVMALNRIQQQRSQNRAAAAAQTTLQYQHGLGFRPPLDTEYQSGDSIDSTMAEDSCGSDSSSASDLMD